MAYVDDLKKIFTGSRKILMPGDSKPMYQLSLSQIDEIKQLQFDETVTRYIEQGFEVQTAEECKKHTFIKMAGDMLSNRANGFGTALDPSIYTRSIMPVMCGAGEASAIYAGGGLPACIIDKKATAMVLDGATFVTHKLNEKQWPQDKLDMLEEQAQLTGFNDAAGDAIRDAYLYGGSALYPMFSTDRPSRMLADMKRTRIEKGSIKRWVEIDRWNTVFVPSFIPTAADYITPKTIMICQEAIEISTSRICLLRPRPQPYWAIIANMGWAPSDIAGWIRAYYAYEVTQMAIPVMAQQMSLLLYRMPLDALNATVGTENVEKLMAVNEEQMKNWSALSPKAVNMVGEVEVVDRTYSGFDQFVGAIKSDLASQTEIPEPALWHTPNKGFADNTQESLLKQSETLKMRQHYIERYMRTAKDMLIAHTFGSDSEEYKLKDLVQLRFDKPMITTETELAEIGARFSASINSFVQAGMSPDTAITMAKPLFPSIKITDKMIAEVRKSYEDRLAKETVAMSQSSVGGKGKAKGSTNRATNGTGGR